MSGTDEHNELLEWLLDDAANCGDVAYAEHLVHAIGMFFLHQSNPGVYETLASTMKQTRSRAMQPQQIGQLVAKQDNNFMMGKQLEGVLKVLLPKMTQDHD